MHKKIIHGKEYYYASYREDGKVKSKYLGSDKKLAIKKEREFNGTGPGGLWMYGLIIILLGLCSIGGYTITGFMTYDGGVDLAWNETWDVESSFVRVSLGAEVYDVPVSVVDGVVSLDLSSFDFNHKFDKQ